MEEILIVYRNNGTTSESRFSQESFWVELRKNGKPVGLKSNGIFIPFAVEEISWDCASHQIGSSKLLNSTELLVVLSEEFREAFDFCATRLEYPHLGAIRIPLVAYSEGCNLHPIHRRRYAPLFYPSQMSEGYAERFLPQEMRLARRM